MKNKIENSFKFISIIILVTLIIGFILGWLFPVEGPIDYVYDEKVKKVPSKVAPPIQEKPIFIEISEEDIPEWYTIVPVLNEVK